MYRVRIAWSSGNLDAMLRVLSVPTNRIDRHFLLMGIVKETYRMRADPIMAAKCAEISELHLAEFSGMVPALKSQMGGVLPQVTTFQHYSTLLTERHDFARAIAVCELAMDYGLRDYTKSGFPGRIARIRKKQAQASGQA